MGLIAAGLLGLFKRPVLLVGSLVALIGISFVVNRFDMKIGGGILGSIFGYPTFWAHLLPYFVAGMTFFALGNRVRFTRIGALVALGAVALGCQVPSGLLVVLPLAAGYLILLLAFLPTRHVRNFAAHGDYSYGIYLYAFPIEQILEHWNGNRLPFPSVCHGMASLDPCRRTQLAWTRAPLYQIKRWALGVGRPRLRSRPKVSTSLHATAFLLMPASGTRANGKIARFGYHLLRTP